MQNWRREKTQSKKNGNHIWEHHKSYACNFGAVVQNERAHNVRMKRIMEKNDIAHTRAHMIQP